MIVVGSGGIDDYYEYMCSINRRNFGSAKVDTEEQRANYFLKSLFFSPEIGYYWTIGNTDSVFTFLPCLNELLTLKEFHLLIDDINSDIIPSDISLKNIIRLEGDIYFLLDESADLKAFNPYLNTEITTNTITGVFKGHPRLYNAVVDYWSWSEDKELRGKKIADFSHSVSSLRKKYQIPSKLAGNKWLDASVDSFYLINETCSKCGEPYVVNSRDDYKKWLGNPTKPCFKCLELEAADRKAIEEQRRLNAELQVEQWKEEYAEYVDSLKSEALPIEDMDFKALVFLKAYMNALASDDNLSLLLPMNTTPKDIAPDDYYGLSICKYLHRNNAIGINSRYSNVDWINGSPEGTYQDCFFDVIYDSEIYPSPDSFFGALNKLEL